MIKNRYKYIVASKIVSKPLTQSNHFLPALNCDMKKYILELRFRWSSFSKVSM